MTEFEGKAVLDHGMLLSYHSLEISRRFPPCRKQVLHKRLSGTSLQASLC